MKQFSELTEAEKEAAVAELEKIVLELSAKQTLIIWQKDKPTKATGTGKLYQN